jgi:short-subunit dehydrogenase/acyl carrier protein
VEGRWLIFAGGDELADQLAFRLAEFGQNAMVVRQGARYRPGNGSTWEIGADLRVDIARLLREEPWTKVVLLPGVEAEEGPADAGGCALGLAVAQGMLQAESGAALSLVTRGSQAVRGSLVAPAQTPLAGFALAIAYERPELRCSLIDLDSAAECLEAEELAAELLGGGDEMRVAWRQGERFVSRLEEAAMPSGDRASLNPEATYLITGGLGSLGLRTAERMVRDGARHLVLTSRSAAESPGVEALRLGGATVMVVACDLSRSEEVERLFAETLATMPPLRGVVHSAGVVEDALLPQQTVEGFRRVMSAKVAGAWNLHRETQALALDFFVMYSSAASLIGAAGQANYASANAFLDGLAHYRRSLGLTAVSLNWGAWSGDGMASRTEVQERLAALGVSMISATDGLDLLSIVLAGGDVPAQLGVFPADWERFTRHLPAQLRLRLSGIVPLAAIGAGEKIATQLKRASDAERTELLRGYLPRMLAMVLGYKSADALNLRQRFFELGMDSLTAIEFRNRLQEELGVVLPSSLAFDYPDVSSLSDYLANAVFPSNASKLQMPVEAAGDSAAMAEREASSRLSSDELAQLLVQELVKGGTDVC